MRHTEFWARMERRPGSRRTPATWAEQQVISDLGHRTVTEALDAGEPPKQVWRAVWERLGRPPSEK